MAGSFCQNVGITTLFIHPALKGTGGVSVTASSQGQFFSRTLVSGSVSSGKGTGKVCTLPFLST